MSWESDSGSSSSDEDVDVDMLRPDSYVEDSEEEEYEPELPTTGGYGDGHFGDEDDYGFDEGEEVAF